MIKELMLNGFEKTTNLLLNMDPDNKKNLNSLKEQSFQIEISDWDLSFYIEISAQNILFNRSSNIEPICHIKGKLWDFIALSKPNALKFPKIRLLSLGI